MLACTSDCLSSWLRCAEKLQLWCIEVTQTSSRCVNLLMGTESDGVASCFNNVQHIIRDLAADELNRLKTLISADLLHFNAVIESAGDKGHCSDVQVITRCLRAVVETQRRFFQSAAGQLTQLAESFDNATIPVAQPIVSLPRTSSASLLSYSGDSSTKQQLENTVKPLEVNDVLISLTAVSRPPPGLTSVAVESMACNKQLPWPPPGPKSYNKSVGAKDNAAVSFMPSVASLPAASKGYWLPGSLSEVVQQSSFGSSSTLSSVQHNAGRCATDEDLNLVIKMLSSHPGINGTHPFSSLVRVPSSVQQQQPQQQQQQSLGVGTTFSSASGHRSSETSPLSRMEYDVTKTTYSWPQLDVPISQGLCGNQSQQPPKVLIEDTWPTHASELWPHYPGWSANKKQCEPNEFVSDSVCNDELCGDSALQQHQYQAKIPSIVGPQYTHRRRHSSGEHPSLPAPFTEQTTPSTPAYTWPVAPSPQVVKERSTVTSEGHRPLFMQRSDPLGQRSAGCWQNKGGNSLSVYSTSTTQSATPSDRLF